MVNSASRVRACRPIDSSGTPHPGPLPEGEGEEAPRSLPMSSNSKPKGPAKEAPTEPFKRAVTGCLRAIARHPELEVSFAAERPGMVGGKARLPEPPRKL